MNSYQIAAADARKEIEQIDIEIRKLEELRKRRAVLEQMLDVALQLGGIPQQQDLIAAAHIATKNRTVEEIMRDMDSASLWKGIEMVMGLRRQPMTANQVLAGLEANGIAVNGDHKRETVRGAMTRKPEIFERVGRGRFALSRWPDEMKRPPSDEEDVDSGDTLEDMISHDADGNLTVFGVKYEGPTRERGA